MKKIGKQMMKQGLVQVYTGNTAQINLSHIGLTLRATGQNLRTFVMGFIPHPFIATEDKAFSFFKDQVVVERLQLEHVPSDDNLHSQDIDKSNIAIEHIQEIISSGAFDIIILEDINHIIDLGIISVNSVTNLIEKKPANVELVLTGRNAKNKIIEKADLVTEMVEHRKEGSSWKIDGSSQEGCVGVITGNGKGKTTHCLGRAMFFAANGIRSSVLQFIKSPQPYGEVIALKTFPNLEIKSMGKGFIFGPSNGSDIHIKAAKNAWAAAEKEVSSGKYRLIVLDEINIATNLGLLDPDLIKHLISVKPKNMHIILSGRNASQEIQEIASSIIEMKEIKHPFSKGIKARKGIEY
ncbi:MAG: cob(I)yrinic acid a,c-diamide adenosyltransferase [Desulfatiglandales bacterium]